MAAPPANGGSPVISYTATVRQGEYSQTITTSATSVVFDGLFILFMLLMLGRFLRWLSSSQAGSLRWRHHTQEENSCAFT